MDEMNWSCILSEDRSTITIKKDNAIIGKYYLIREPFCHKCCLPLDPAFQYCSFCAGDENYELARSVGLYFKVDYETQLLYINRAEDDLLSLHILYLKNKRGYARNKSWAIPLGLAMSMCFKNLYEELHLVNIIVPVPQHQDSINRRGYNQSEEIAKIVSKKIELPLYSDLLIKTRDEKMMGKSRDERKEAVKGLYKSSKKLNGESVLLIDDTFTTGCTVDECARVLKEAGAKEVYVFVAGRDAPEF